MTRNRFLTAVVLLLALLGQGVVLAGAGGHGMCGMAEAAMPGMSADCDHPSPHADGMCAQCVQCASGHCVAWAVPPSQDALPSTRPVNPATSVSADRAPDQPPARLYRPPRLSA